MAKHPKTQKEVFEDMKYLYLKNDLLSPLDTHPKDFSKKIKDLLITLIKNQIAYEKLKKSTLWEQFPKEARDTLDQMSGGIWLKGDELEQIEKMQRG
jgi:hypothetical protein